MKFSFIPPNRCTLIVIECRTRVWTFKDEDWIADELNTKNYWNRSDQVNSNKTYLFCIWQHWDVKYVQANKWNPNEKNIWKVNLVFSLCVTFIWISFKITQVWLFCVCMCTFPKPIIDPSYSRVVICHLSHKLQLKYSSTFLSFFFAFLPLFHPIISLFQNSDYSEMIWQKFRVGIRLLSQRKATGWAIFNPILFFILFSLFTNDPTNEFYVR